MLIPPSQSPSSSNGNNQRENLESAIEINRVNNFGLYKSSDENDISRMISTSRPYSGREFNQVESSRQETNNSCEFVPSSNMIRHETLLHGLALFIDQNVQLTSEMLDQGKQLAFLLSSLASEVFLLSVQTMHLFRDIDSGK